MSAVLKDEVRMMWLKRSVGVSQSGDVFRTLMYNRIQLRRLVLHTVTTVVVVVVVVVVVEMNII